MVLFLSFFQKNIIVKLFFSYFKITFFFLVNCILWSGEVYETENGLLAFSSSAIKRGKLLV